MMILRSLLLSFFGTLLLILGVLWVPGNRPFVAASGKTVWWEIQSIDTMKYSRDLSREKANDQSFDREIDRQIADIANLGANYVGIATPYDDEFVPMLRRWVAAARAHGLRVWFRGNFSGWEEWFDYPRLTREEHAGKLAAFITKNASLFADGDIFTPCPECENGGPGDPRKTGDISGHRSFLIQERELATQAFKTVKKQVEVGYFSMNYDVASLVMDKETTKALGGVVTIDHYVATPGQLARDIERIAMQSGGKVFLGEMGAPIPDIHGTMSDEAQYTWIATALSSLQQMPSLVGINYWVNRGGSTHLWNDDGTARMAVAAIEHAYAPKQVTGTVVNQFNRPITNATIKTPWKNIRSDSSGRFILPYLSLDEEVSIELDNYTDMTLKIHDISNKNKIIIRKIHLNPFESVLAYIINLFDSSR